MRGSSDVSPNSPALIALKPRQVLLEQQQRSRAAFTPMAKNQPEDDSILTFSVALWLENKGFSKVLKRFLSAAQIQDDSWKAKALNLNEIFSKYQEIFSSAREDLKSQKKQEFKKFLPPLAPQTDEHVGRTDKIVDANGTKPEEIHKKKKKSKGNIAVKDADRTVEDVVMSEKMNNSYVNGNEDQNQKTSSLGQKNQNTKVSKESNGDEVPELSEDPSTKKQKEKKRKKSKLADSDENKVDVMPQVTELKDGSLSKSSAESLEKEHVVDKKSKRRLSEDAEDGVNDSKKASKKRKRIDSDENENQSGQEAAVEETKSKKSKGLEANGHADEDKGETFGAGGAGLENAKQSDESNKSALSNGMDKSSQQKSSNRQPKSSEQPKPVKAFQRVKVDEVEFVDERLQDNSYWAKDGADSGYGAKAQEVLGQVKGRDFRHEKTKKKRGSYRGGYIDQECHSVKFNYSDEE